MNEMLKQGGEFSGAVRIAMRNRDFSQVIIIYEVINSNIISQYKYLMTLINKYHKEGDKINSNFLIQNLKYLENIERLNIMAREVAKEYIRN